MTTILVEFDSGSLPLSAANLSASVHGGEQPYERTNGAAAAVGYTGRVLSDPISVERAFELVATTYDDLMSRLAD